MTDEASERDGGSATPSLYISQRLRVSLPEHSTSHMMPECSGKLTLNDLQGFA